MPQSSDPTSPKLPKGYSTVEPGSIEKAWIAAGRPNDSSDVIDRTKPQSLSSRMSETWFDAKNTVSGLIDEANRELHPQPVASASPTVPAGYKPVTYPNEKFVPPSPAMDEAMKRAGMIPAQTPPSSK